MIHAKGIHLTFGEQIIFDNESFTLQADQRIGLVGRNGAGKSTLLKVIAGLQPLDGGSCTISGKKKIAYMPQEIILTSQKSVIEETLTALDELASLQQRSAQLEKELASDTADMTTLLEEYAEVSEKLAQMLPERVEARAQQILEGLGFSKEQQNGPVQSLSLGWKMRIVLAKLLLQDADFYLFDEPTNHLDIVAKDWFLNFLKTTRCGFALVCHERYFLDQLCTQILEIEHGKAIFYNGNFSSYEQQKELFQEQRERAFEQQQKEIKQKEATINRFRSKSSKAKMVQSMIKGLEKIERITLPPQPKDIIIKLKPAPRAGRIVLDVNKVAHTFGDKKIFNNATFKIERQEKVALIAPNGVGKTTLFNVITGKLPLQHGTVTLGHNATPALFAQDQAKALDGTKNIMENCKAACPKATEQEIRSLLGAFLFDQEAIEKRVSVLSGGEKNRVGMVCTLLQNANLLLLDEPTNNLDIPSKEILLKALKNYDGTIFFVSHDHDFVDRLATRIIELSANGTSSYHGNYSAYCYQKREHELNNASITAGTTKQTATIATVSKKEQFEQNKKMRNLEKQVAKLEKEIEKLEHSFATLTYGTDEFSRTEKTLAEKRKDLDEALQSWEELI